MQAEGNILLTDIFGIFGGYQGMAAALGEKPDTVYRWWKRGRIPEIAWSDVISAAAKRGRILTASDILLCNATMKKRGWPRKVRAIRRRRTEARAT